ncbi:sensor histidine kinase [Paeniglutamicibacter gangotriensis]|nr:hypothetical protein [Paeniglutamicibacter gangotriensis]
MLSEDGLAPWFGSIPNALSVIPGVRFVVPAQHSVAGGCRALQAISRSECGVFLYAHGNKTRVWRLQAKVEDTLLIGTRITDYANLALGLPTGARVCRFPGCAKHSTPWFQDLLYMKLWGVGSTLRWSPVVGRRRYAEWVNVDAQHPKFFGLHNPVETPKTSHEETVLRVLRMGLYVGLARVLSPGPGPVRGITVTAPNSLLAAPYLVGTVQEKCHAAGRAPSTVPWAKWGLCAVVVLWLVLLYLHVGYSWLAFTLFFLHQKILGHCNSLLAVALLTVGVIAAGWFHSGPAVLGPVIWAVFTVIMGMVCKALYTEDVNQRAALDELPATRAAITVEQHRARALEERTRLARKNAGIPTKPRSDGTRNGLIGLHERLELLGGTLKIESAPGEGTVLAVCVPYTIEESQGR